MDTQLTKHDYLKFGKDHTSVFVSWGQGDGKVERLNVGVSFCMRDGKPVEKHLRGDVYMAFQQEVMRGPDEWTRVKDVVIVVDECERCFGAGTKMAVDVYVAGDADGGVDSSTTPHTQVDVDTYRVLGGRKA